MKPQLHRSLKVAHEVLRQLDLPYEIARQVVVTGYENGREHGLALTVQPPNGQAVTVAWSENRNSDQIVVYVGLPGESFALNTNVPTERAYRAAQFFNAHHVPYAAQHISEVVARAWTTEQPLVRARTRVKK